MMWLLLAVISVVSTLATTQTFVPTGYHSSAQIGTKLYVFGGYTVKGNDGYNQITTQVAVLDLSKEFSPQSLPAWVLKSSMPKAIMGGQVDIDSSKALIYLWGGIVSEKADNPQGHAEVANKVVYKYSIAEDKWSVVENTTGNGRVWPCENRLAVPNSRRLFFGGKRDIGPVNDPTHSEICFLESGNVKCNPGPKGPSPRLSGVFHEVKPQNYLLFSGSEGDMTFADVWTFDADSFSWTLQAATISNRSSVSSILYDKHLFLFGGWPNSNGTMLLDVINTENFQVSKPLITGSFPLWKRFYDATFTLIGNQVLIYGGQIDDMRTVNPLIYVVTISPNPNGVYTLDWGQTYKANLTALATLPNVVLPEVIANGNGLQDPSRIALIVGPLLGAIAIGGIAGYLIHRRRVNRNKIVKESQKEESSNFETALEHPEDPFSAHHPQANIQGHLNRTLQTQEVKPHSTLLLSQIHGTDFAVREGYQSPRPYSTPSQAHPSHPFVPPASISNPIISQLDCSQYPNSSTQGGILFLSSASETSIYNQPIISQSLPVDLRTPQDVCSSVEDTSLSFRPSNSGAPAPYHPDVEPETSLLNQISESNTSKTSHRYEVSPIQHQ